MTAATTTTSPADDSPEVEVGHASMENVAADHSSAKDDSKISSSTTATKDPARPSVNTTATTTTTATAAPRQHVGGVVLLGIAFLLIFSAYNVVQSLASSTLPPSVAFQCLAFLYVAFALSNLLLAAPIVDRLGPRASLFLASVPYALLNVAYTVAIGRAGEEGTQMAILVPFSVLIGLGAGVLWTAQGTYLSRCGSAETAGYLSGIFFGITGLAGMVGPLLTALLLHLNVDKVKVFGILSAVGAGGPVLLIYVWMRPEPWSNDPESVPSTPRATSANELPDEEVVATSQKTPQRAEIFRTIKMFGNLSMLALAPLFCVSAVVGSFYSGSIPLFVHTGDDTVDLRNKLLMFATLAAASVVTSFTIGKVTDKIGPLPMTVAGFLILSGIMLALTFGHPTNNLALLFPGFVVLGFSDAMITNQTYKLLPLVFPRRLDKSAAFSAYWFFRAITTGIGFAVSRMLLNGDGEPMMPVWTPLIVGLYALTVIGVYAAVHRGPQVGS